MNNFKTQFNVKKPDTSSGEFKLSLLKEHCKKKFSPSVIVTNNIVNIGRFYVYLG